MAKKTELKPLTSKDKGHFSSALLRLDAGDSKTHVTTEAGRVASRIGLEGLRFYRDFMGGILKLERKEGVSDAMQLIGLENLAEYQKLVYETSLNNLHKPALLSR